VAEVMPNRTESPNRTGSRPDIRVMVRADALPEHAEYRDEGCELSPSCLACPLVRCRYDVPGGARALLNRERDREIRAMREREGLSAEAIAERFGVSRRTVFRVLAAPSRSGRRAAEAGGRS
jgi:AraC-like DNA-binding protein